MTKAKKAQKRNTTRILISLYPEDLAALDAIAERLKEPGAEPNRSQAVRHVIREGGKIAKRFFR